MKRITVLFSESSRGAKWRRAKAADRLYPARDGDGRAEQWVRGEDAYLGVNGCRHFLWRLGLPHRRLEESQIDWKALDGDDQLWIPEGETLLSRSVEAVERIAASGRTQVIATGATNLPGRLFRAVAGGNRRLTGWLTCGDPEGADGVLPVLAPPGCRITDSRSESSEPIPALEERALDPQSGPGRGAPAGPLWHRRGNAFWVPAPCFEYWGGLLQGQTDWWPLRGVVRRESHGYLDRLFFWFAGILSGAGVAAIRRVRISPWGSRDHAVVLRHDTDDSADPGFWTIEREKKIPATYAVLDDQRARTWSKRLQETPHLETALHYRSNRIGWLETARMRWLKQLPRPDRKAVSPRGLVAQLRRSRERLGAVRTLHRHYHYLHYPEHLFSLEYLFREAPEILGAGSFARFHLFRYGGTETALIRHPGAGIPFSFPVRPVIATCRRQSPLSGWEIGGVMEPDEAALTRTFRFAESFPGGAYLWVFHPAHTRHWAHRPGGTRPAFEAAVRQIDSRWWPTTVRALYERMNLWSRLEIRKSAAGWELFNGGEGTFPELTVFQAGRRLALGDLEKGKARRLEPASGHA